MTILSYMLRPKNGWRRSDYIGLIAVCRPGFRDDTFTHDRYLADNREELVTYIIQYCLFPRALLSPMDADFAAQFIKVLHNLGTKNFWTVGCYNKVFSEQLGSVVFSCTQNEARNYGKQYSV